MKGKEMYLTLIRYFISAAAGYLAVELTPEQQVALSIAIFGMTSAACKTILKPLFYKYFGERQPGDTKSGETPKAPVDKKDEG